MIPKACRLILFLIVAGILSCGRKSDPKVVTAPTGNIKLAVAVPVPTGQIKLAVAVPVPTGKIKLAVIVVFDQMRGDYLGRWENLFGEGGFRRLMTEGA